MTIITEQGEVAATGIDGPDYILGGGFPKNHIYLVQGDPGVLIRACCGGRGHRFSMRARYSSAAAWPIGFAIGFLSLVRLPSPSRL